MPGFDVDASVVLPDQVLYHGPQRWLLWPALRYRVVSPLVHEQCLNAFQSAVLGLARAGFRKADDIGRLLGLQPDLIDLVRSDLRALAYLDRYGAVTDTGRRALHDNFLDPTRTITTYVYQDVTTGTLWPASTITPGHAQVTWHGPHQATVQLRTAGSPLRMNVFPVTPTAWTATEPPEHEQVVEAVSRAEKAKRQTSVRARRWDLPAPDRVASRVALMTSGVPVWIPLPLLLDRQGREGFETVSWDARNPFTGRASTYLRKLVATRLQQSAALRDYVERFVGRRTEAFLLEYDLLDIALRRRIAEVLENRFTIRLREHGNLVELLTLLERDIKRVRRHSGGSPELVGDVVRNAWKLHEAVFRDVVVRYRPSAEVSAELRDPLAQQLGECCRRIGISFNEQARVSFISSRNLKTALKRPEDAKTPALLAAALVSAAHSGHDHVFQRLAAERPNLLTDLTHLSQDRNEASHAQTVPLNLEYGEAAWRLAQDTTAAYLGLPLPDLSTLSGRDFTTDAETA